MPRIRYPRKQYLEENDQLKDNIRALVDAIVAVQEYHAALDFLDVTSRKADQMLVVKQKKQEYDFCLEQVADLIAE